MRAIYDDIMATLGMPFVNTSWRALARWPSYFNLAWSDLKSSTTTATYKALADRIFARALELASRLPNPGGSTTEALQQARG